MDVFQEIFAQEIKSILLLCPALPSTAVVLLSQSCVWMAAVGSGAFFADRKANQTHKGRERERERA